jgi:acetyltransferase-like isoleucine patch superfamily enzyme
VLGVNDEVPWPVHFTSRVTGNVEIGSKVWKSFAVSGGCYIQGINGVSIDDGVMFGPGVRLISANHSRDCLDPWVPASPISIGKNSWLGANVVVLPGVRIGQDCIIGAGAVVTRDVPDGLIAAGVPAEEVSKGST